MTELALQKVSKSVEDFTIDFHKNVSKGYEGNLVSSALSAHAVLSMAALGADGQTARTMREALYLSDDDAVTCQGFKALIDSFKNAPDVILKVANKICVSNGIRIKEEFKSAVNNFFYSESIELDYSQIQRSVDMINNWCYENTEGKIEGIVDAASLSCSGLILLNAVYFKGNWESQFDKDCTKNRPFHVNEATTVDVPTMFIQDYFFYEELKDVKATCIALPYENQDLAMVIVIPKDIDGLKNVEKNLKETKIDYEKLNGNKQKMNLMLPKFKISSSIDLNKSLEEMGLSIIFTDKSDFKNISDQPMKVGSVVQKAFIEVNEEGTEAVAVTGVAMALRCARKRRPPIDVIVDRPFLYRIVNIKHKVTLFSGHIVNPLEK